MSYIADKKIPIVIGVTGHRQLADENHVKCEITKVIKEVLDEFPSSPVILQSALAIGADSIAAEAVIELKSDIKYKDRLKLFCPLPMNKEEYEKDFTIGDERDRFNKLFDLADHGFGLPLASSKEKCDEVSGLLIKERNNGTQFEKCSERNNRYALLGGYLSRYSHFLLAIWDGEETDKKGGTYHVIRDRLYGDGFSDLIQKRRTGVSYDDTLLPSVPVLEMPDSGAIIHIKCHRTKNNKPNASTCYFPNNKILFSMNKDKIKLNSNSDKAARSSYQSICSFLSNICHINEFNDHVSKFSKADLDRYNGSKSYLFNDEACDVKNDEVTSHLISVAAAADSLALSRQETAFKDFNIIAVLSLLTVAFFLYNDKISDHSWVTTAIYTMLFLVTYMLGWFFGKKQAQQQHSRNRVLAEGLRVQIAWRIAGLHSTVFSKYPHKYRNNIGWVRHALRGLHVGSVSQVDLALSEPALERIRRQWIEDQLDYYENNKINRNGGYIKAFSKLLQELFQRGDSPTDSIESSIKKVKPYIRGLYPLVSRAKLWSSGLIILGVTFGFLFSILSYLTELNYINSYVLAEYGVSIVILMLVPIAAALTMKMYLQRMLLEEDLEWYEHSLELFKNAAKALQKPGDREKSASILLELGREVLHENAAWFDVHSKVILNKNIQENLSS